MNRQILAIIPARAGSKGVPHKNICPLSGYPLIAYSIAAAKLSQRINRVIISTDSEEIADVARHYGAELPFLRPAALAEDHSPDRDFVCHALGWLQAHEGRSPDLLVHLRPTTPLRDVQVIDAAVDALSRNPEATSLRSGHEAPESPFKWFTRDARGFFHRIPLASTTPLPTDLNMRRQNFPIAYVPNGYVDVLRAATVQTADTIHGSMILGYLTPVGLEVDTIDDFEYIQYQFTRRGSALLDYLRAHYPQGGA